MNNCAIVAVHETSFNSLKFQENILT